MGREIKFRAWSDKRMVYPTAALGKLSRFFKCIREDAELMQFTGLKDKNGKDVYEGDILGGSFVGGYIYYCDSCKQIQYHLKDFGCMACEGDVNWYELMELSREDELEIIGNIYENPELLNP